MFDRIYFPPEYISLIPVSLYAQRPRSNDQACQHWRPDERLLWCLLYSVYFVCSDQMYGQQLSVLDAEAHEAGEMLSPMKDLPTSVDACYLCKHPSEGSQSGLCRQLKRREKTHTMLLDLSSPKTLRMQQGHARDHEARQVGDDV